MVSTNLIYFHDTDRPSPLHTLEGLTRYLETPAKAPALLDDAALQDLSNEERDAYDRERIVYLGGGIVLATPDMLRAQKLLYGAFAKNAGRNSGHNGLMVTGHSSMGKTTLAKRLMSEVHKSYWRSFSETNRNNRIPVVYIEVPSGCTQKLLMRAFADFLGLSVRSGEPTITTRTKVVSALLAAHTQLIVVDELHNLADRTNGNGESVDLLKGLHNDLPATFLYLGIDLTTERLLEGARGRQLSGRFTVLELKPLRKARTEDKRDWIALVKGFEKKLPLRDHAVGTLAPLSDYLWDRTGGSIGSLSQLLTGAAIDAISEGKTETLTKELLDAQVLDHAAELSYQASLNRKARRAPAVPVYDDPIPDNEFC